MAELLNRVHGEKFRFVDGLLLRENGAETKKTFFDLKTNFLQAFVNVLSTPRKPLVNLLLTAFDVGNGNRAVFEPRLKICSLGVIRRFTTKVLTIHEKSASLFQTFGGSINVHRFPVSVPGGHPDLYRNPDPEQLQQR